MKKEQFEIIMNALENRKALCSKHLDGLHTTDDIRKLTLAAASELKTFCV